MLLLATLLAVVIGWYVVRLAWPPELFAALRPLRIMLAWGVGSGVVSLAFFANLLLVGEAQTGCIWGAEVALLGLLLVANRRVRATTPSSLSSEQRPAGPAFVALFAIAFFAAIVCFVLATLEHPHGIVDAVSIWNMRAQMLFDSGTAWRRALVPELPHPDYPLLIPCLVTRTWQGHGAATTVVPALVAAGFTFGSVGLLWASLRVLRGTRRGYVAGGALLSCPAFLAAGPTQYADLPLGFFMLCTLVLIALQDHFCRRDLRFVYLAGLALGLGAWTKNEGAVFLVVLPIARVVARRRHGWRPVREELLALAVGAAPALVALLAFKWSLASTNDLVGQVSAGTAAAHACDATRWVEILRALADTVWSFGPLLLLAAFAWLCVHRRDLLGLPLVAMGLVLLGYLAVYLLVSPNLTWHLSTSMQRLVLQLLPATLFGLFSGRPDLARPASAACTSVV